MRKLVLLLFILLVTGFIMPASSQAGEIGEAVHKPITVLFLGIALVCLTGAEVWRRRKKQVKKEVENIKHRRLIRHRISGAGGNVEQDVEVKSKQLIIVK